MKFQLNVYGSPWSTNSAQNAIDFATIALENDQQIKRIFFFFDGVYHGLNSQSPASDEYDLIEQWKQLNDQGVELLLCIAASANRGVLNSTEAERYDKPNVTAASCFEVTGLGQWATGFHDCDRIVTFK